MESSNNSEVFAEIDVVIYKYSQELLNVYQAFEDEDILGGNYALNEIDTDLDLMTNISGITLTWQSSREDVIATDGKVTLQDLAVTVTLTVTFSKEGDDTLEKPSSCGPCPVNRLRMKLRFGNLTQRISRSKMVKWL